MGSSSSFEGSFTVSPAMAPQHIAYLKQFAATRRMARTETVTAQRPDPIRVAANLPVGLEGAYFVGEEGFMGQAVGPDVTSSRHPPHQQPNLWCQWVPSSDGTAIQWDGGEKFDDPQEWIQYLADHFLKPWGYTITGTVEQFGYDGHELIEVK